MNKSIKYLALAAVAVSANISATNTDMTYMNLRSANVNLPMELTTFYERTQMKLDHRFGGNLQVSGFYGESGGDFGDYFGINGSTFILGTPAQQKATPQVAPTLFDYLIHDFTDANATSPINQATVPYDPETKSYGARFDYYQNMDKLLKGLYLKVNTTVVCVKNEMEMNISKGVPAASDTTDGAQAWLQGFLQGTYSVATTDPKYPNDAQVALDHGLIKGEHSETGLADIDVILGYKFLYKDKYHFGINIAITIPTGEKADGKDLFEAIYGNGGHFGLGGGLDAHANLWTKDDQDIKLNFMLNYRYLFEEGEHRVLGLNDYYSPYVLLGDATQAAGNQSLIPLANVLTPKGVNVTPGSQLDGILALAYNKGGFSADLGYNLYYREAEDVDFKGSIDSERYGVAAITYATNNGNVFGTDATNFDGGVTGGTKYWISKSDVNTSMATTPSQFTNGIYGGLGYHFKKWEYPLLLGVGGKYDWASNENSSPDYWMVWGKLSLSF